MTAPLYKPPTKVSTRSVPILAVVTRADPDFQRQRLNVVEYEFTGKVFRGIFTARGAYNRLGNTYPVGQPQGAPDPLITAALAPTVGNPLPGLYSGVDDGKGWS